MATLHRGERLDPDKSYESVKVLDSPCPTCGCQAYDNEGRSALAIFTKRLGWAMQALPGASRLHLRLVTAVAEGTITVEGLELSEPVTLPIQGSTP